jgi:type VI secretion system secreted protein Hcp
VNHEIVVPRSPATGLPTSKRHHKLLTLRREVSQASIGIRQAITSNEILSEVRIRFYQAMNLGTPRQTYMIQLFKAHCCALRLNLVNTRAQAKGSIGLFEEVSFAYLTIQWTWNDPNMVATDDWLAGR